MHAAYDLSAPHRSEFEALYRTLDEFLTDMIADRWLRFGPDIEIWTNGNYLALWPDDFLYPLIVQPRLMDSGTMTKLLDFLIDTFVDLPLLPDRVEPDGMPVMNPGPAMTEPYGDGMPLHLPAAWTRLLDYLSRMGATINRKSEWAAAIARGFDDIPFSRGLVYINPQRPRVGFGFHDPCAITGFELMSSVVLSRGLERAATIFADVYEQSSIDTWRRRSRRIVDNLDMLFDEDYGAFLAGSYDCRQVDVWANGLAYGLVGEEKQRRIAEWYVSHRDEIFSFGYTRQIAEPDGWKRHIHNVALGTYTNGGYWATGTGYVLPVLARHQPGLAVELGRELVKNLSAHDFAESVTADGGGRTNPGFIPSVALPMIALKCILEDRLLIDLF